MIHPSRHLVLLVPVCLLAGSAWLSGCRPPAGQPADTANPRTLRPAVAASVPAPRELAFRQDGFPVVSLTYDSQVFFNSDQDRARPEAAAVLDALAARLKRQVPAPHVAVLGHTDAVGSDAYNLDLSRRRARSVVRALVQRGVDPATLEAVAVGKRQPVASDETEAGRARNRRVEFLISPSARAVDAVIRARPQVLRLHERHPPAEHLQARQPDALTRAPLGAPVTY
jgi:outer membrane protein OmpA-like peptidoglycan-associated protein